MLLVTGSWPVSMGNEQKTKWAYAWREGKKEKMWFEGEAAVAACPCTWA